jgi:hypothetical protein
VTRREVSALGGRQPELAPPVLQYTDCCRVGRPRQAARSMRRKAGRLLFTACLLDIHGCA